ncbi:MAG: hypothetical protein R3362_00760 [Rhodothermales bacterium]|nr:hypothetical protein [Rhodothermales bacterium]
MRTSYIRPALVFALLLTACGNPTPEEAPSAEPTRGETAPSDAPAVENAVPVVNAASIRVTGDVDTTLTLRGDDVRVTGGCDGNAPMSIGFSQGLPTEAGYVNLAFDTADAVGTGATGAFEVREVRWDHGTVYSERMRGRAPNRFSGAGTLELEVHDATMAHATAGRRQLAGTLRGTGLTNAEGLAADVEADLVINLSCGVSA